MAAPVGLFGFAAPLALGGESITGNGTAIAVLSAISIVGGYLLLAGLWYFVFRDRSRKTSDVHSTKDTQQPKCQDKPPAPAHPTTSERRGVRFRRR
ncbi:MAG TPA: hypothetical protein VGF15_05155 [Solirubrobacteraceae bacterium]